jgi:hypothetical protein
VVADLDADVRGPELVSVTDEKRARAVYNLSGRQLRSIRSAALSGSLARRAAELGVSLPDGYAERVSERNKRHDSEGIAA